MKRMSMDDKLALNRFHTDDHNSHIDVDKEFADKDEIMKVVLACPAGCYRIEENGSTYFSHLGCLECGTCRVLSHGKLVREWNHPIGSIGVQYREG